MADAADQGVSHGVERVLRLLLRLVRHRAVDGRGQARPGAQRRADRLVRHRVGGHDHPGPAGDRLALRPRRAAADLHLAAGARVAARDGHGARRFVRDLSGTSAVDRLHWRLVRDHPVSHLGDVRAQRRGDGQRDFGGLGKPRRRRHATGHAAGVRAVRRHAGAGRSAGLAGRHGRRRSALPGDGRRLLSADPGHTGRQSPRSTSSAAGSARRRRRQRVLAGLPRPPRLGTGHRLRCLFRHRVDDQQHRRPLFQQLLRPGPVLGRIGRLLRSA